MNAIGYAAASPSEALTDPVAFQEAGSRIDEQRAALEAWAARARGRRLVRVVADDVEPDDLPSRLGLAEVIEAIRDGEGDAVVLVRLDRLAPDLLLQEQLIAEFGRIDARIIPLSRIDARQLTHPDPERAALREAIAAVPRFQGDVRALRARHRAVRARGTDEEAMLVELERMGERGIPWRRLRARLGDSWRLRVGERPPQ